MNTKERLILFYQQYCPDKINDIDNIIKKYGNNEKELFRKLTFKYGPESKDVKNIIKKRNISNTSENKNIISSKKKIYQDHNEYMKKFLDEKDIDLLKKIDELELIGQPIIDELLKLI